MAQPDPKLDASGVNALLARAFPGASDLAMPQVLEVAPGEVMWSAPTGRACCDRAASSPARP